MGIKLQKQSFLLVYQKNSEMKSGKKYPIYNSNQVIKYLRLKIIRNTKCFVEHN